jgi:hypothetical protein
VTVQCSGPVHPSYETPSHRRRGGMCGKALTTRARELRSSREEVNGEGTSRRRERAPGECERIRSSLKRA